jgi:flagellar assembly protein FliH
MMEWQRDKTVTPLEFHALETLEEIPETYTSASVMESETRWKTQVAALEAKLAVEAEIARAKIEAARCEAESATRERMSAEMEQRIAENRTEVATLIEQFGRERARYFAEVEAEVVQLALAIAARVLHRETALDSMLLRAAVRVALDKVAGESSVTLRVPGEQAEMWREIFTAERGDGAVVVVADRQLGVGDAVLETGVGRVELGVREQLKEIERGFFDLLEKRPA